MTSPDDGIATYTPDGGRTHISTDHPGRAVRETAMGGGYGLYSVTQHGDQWTGNRVGMTDQAGAYDWLAGLPLSDIKGVLRLPGDPPPEKNQ